MGLDAAAFRERRVVPETVFDKRVLDLGFFALVILVHGRHLLVICIVVNFHLFLIRLNGIVVLRISGSPLVG